MSANPEIKTWTKVANTLGGELQMRYVFTGSRQERMRFGLPSLTVNLDGISVRGEVTGDGDPPATFAQLSAKAAGAKGLKMRVYRNYVYPQFTHVADSGDRGIGDPHFHRNFVVRSNDPSYASLWLGVEARQMMLKAPDFCFEIDEERVTASSHMADDHEQVEAALRAVGLLARRGNDLNRTVSRLATRLSSDSTIDRQAWFAGSSPEFEFISGGRRVLLSIVHDSTGRRGERRLLSRLWCRRLTARSDRFVFYADHLHRKERPFLARKLARSELCAPPGYIVHASNTERLSSRMNEHWSRTIARLAPLMLSCSEGAVELVWSGAMLVEQTLRDAAELCEYFAVEKQAIVSAGPYR